MGVPLLRRQAEGSQRPLEQSEPWHERWSRPKDSLTPVVPKPSSDERSTACATQSVRLCSVSPQPKFCMQLCITEGMNT